MMKILKKFSEMIGYKKVIGHVSGVLNNDSYELHIGEDGFTSEVLCNGKKIDNIKKVEIIIEADKLTKMVIHEYVKEK
mgnify:CR=1 FL=1